MGVSQCLSHSHFDAPSIRYYNRFHSNTNCCIMPGGGLTAPKKLSPELADIVGKKEASRAELMKLLWAYIKEKNLQDPENKQYFVPDKKMAKVFGADKIKGFGMAKFLGPHLSDP